jgi:hypothetical protein
VIALTEAARQPPWESSLVIRGYAQGRRLGKNLIETLLGNYNCGRGLRSSQEANVQMEVAEA